MIDEIPKEITEEIIKLNCLKCHHCSKEFKSKGGLSYHIKKNVCTNTTKPDTFKCIKCNSDFKSKQSLAYHNTNNVCFTVPVMVDNKKCVMCGYVFKTKRSLLNHVEKRICMRTVTNKSPTKDDKDDKDSNKKTHTLQSINNVNNCVINNVIINQINLTCNYGNSLVNLPKIKIKPHPFPFQDAIDTIIIEDYIGSIVSSSLTKYNETIGHTIQNINCNPIYPMYNNIHTNTSLLRMNLCRVFNGISYSTIPKEKGIEQLIKSHINLIDTYIKDHLHLFNNDKGRIDIAKYQIYIKSLSMPGERGAKKSRNKKDLEKTILAMLIDIGKEIDTPEWLDKLQEQYNEYCRADLLRSEMLKDQEILMEIFDTNQFSILLHAAAENMGSPQIIYALSCIESGQKVEWDRVFVVDY